ncbi:hypothetical protein [Sagittula salina]|uniref:Uncharacterized protein n=1 Tax=Sagittula salina TaxID=2820268 RepID=A0A940S448_9RHOB|nr:hypothetical protein [Sagittula salina]MBP0483724.1 hypothetical protein [Sagittula salina]
MRFLHVVGSELAVSLAEAVRPAADAQPDDFRVIYVSPALRALNLSKTEGACLSERQHTCPGTPTFEAIMEAVLSERAQFFDASGPKGVLGYQRLLGLALPLAAASGRIDFALTAVDFYK